MRDRRCRLSVASTIMSSALIVGFAPLAIVQAAVADNAPVQASSTAEARTWSNMLRPAAFTAIRIQGVLYTLGSDASWL